MAEFDDPTSLVAAARRTHEAGYRAHRLVLAVSDPRALRRDAVLHDRRVPLLVLIGGIVGRADGVRAAGVGRGVAYP